MASSQVPIEENVQQNTSLLSHELLLTNPEQSREPGDIPSINIYNVHSHKRRTAILVLLALSSFPFPLSSTMYLPVLSQIEKDLHITTTMANYTISIYLFLLGVSFLIWGPVSDWLGRKKTLLTAFAIFLVNSIMCTFSTHIAMLIIFRTLQGASISAALVVTQSAMVDLYPAEELGRAIGLFSTPFFVGPIIGPLIGGFLSARFGWRSIFVLLAITAIISFLIILIFVPETQHYLVMKRLSNQKKNSIKIIECNTITKPQFIVPWRPLKYLSDVTMVPHIIATVVNFCEYFILVTVMSNHLSLEPYSLSQFNKGLCFAVIGAALLVGSYIGGWTSDWSAKRIPQVSEGRFIFNLTGSLLCPIGLLLVGWTFHFNYHLSVLLIGALLFAVGESLTSTGLSAYTNVKKPGSAGAVLSVNMSLCFICAGISTTFLSPVLTFLKFGFFFSILAAISFFSITLATISAVYQIRKGKPSNSEIQCLS